LVVSLLLRSLPLGGDNRLRQVKNRVQPDYIARVDQKLLVDLKTLLLRNQQPLEHVVMSEVSTRLLADVLLIVISVENALVIDDVLVSLLPEVLGRDLLGASPTLDFLVIVTSSSIV